MRFDPQGPVYRVTVALKGRKEGIGQWKIKALL